METTIAGNGCAHFAGNDVLSLVVIINKKTELNIMVDDIKPHIIGITESWATMI